MSKNESLKKRIYKNIFGMDDITYEINRRLKYIHDSDISYEKKQDELQGFLVEIYKKYDIQAIIKRKLYLQSKLDTQNSIWVNTGLAIIVWLALELMKKVAVFFLTDSSEMTDFLPVVITSFSAMLFCDFISHKLGRHDTKYRKYDLIDFELKIINEIIENNFHYNRITQDIINDRFKRLKLDPDMNDIEEARKQAQATPSNPKIKPS